ncbi:hypothetical protein Lal_00026526 [Lupinus albus]|nr:hypothetical protein Lal_00026526 [Lupinus albus]
MRLTSIRQLARSSFQQQFRTGSIGNTLEQISTTTLTPMRLTSVRQLARSSFRQQFHRDYNFGTTTYDGPPINQSGPSHINADDTTAGYNFGETHYNETSYNEARPSPFHTHEPIGGGQFSSTTCHVVPEQGTSMTYTFHSRHNSARNFRADRRMIASQLPTPTLCTWCNARLFHHETENMCCLRAKVWLQQINAPQQLLDLIVDYSDEGRHFRQHIRGYNHIFAFTSLGVHLDNTLAATGRGIYTFRAQGSIYHNIGGLHPNEGDRPRFMQLYIYDTDHELQNRMLENPQLHENVVSKLQHILHLHNPFVHVFRQLALRTDVHQCSLIIKERPANQPQYNLPTTSQVAAIVVVGDVETVINGRDIKVTTHSGNLMRIQETVGYYDPMQYPILFPYGTYGWDTNTTTHNGRRITCREYYSYMLQIRPDDRSLLLRSGRLLQQYVVDNYVKVEAGRLRWIRKNQNNIRAEVYQGLQDALHVGEYNAANVGQRTVLPSSFIGSRRDLTQRYEDGMAIVLNDGKPDIFLTMTCNPSWPEITSELYEFQTAQDRPDLTTRIFRSKFEQLREDVIDKGVLGNVKSYMYVTEFQKRGLPHVHMLLILENNDKLRSPEEYDAIVRAEIPNYEEEPELHNVGSDSYPEYKRRNDEPVSLNRRFTIDNRWVVPYNPWLLLKYDCHINVEVCSSIKSIKYLYKYVYKGPDRVAMEVHRGIHTNEIQQYVDARWICAPEALWKIFGFNLYQLYPSVVRLQIHLPNRQQVRFYDHQMINDILNDDHNSKTMLTQFFALNNLDVEARHYLYTEIPKHYTWGRGNKEWQRRRNRRRVLGRMYTVSPSEGDKFYLRVLLNHVRGPTSWEDLLTVNGTCFPTFKQSAQERGLLEGDDSIRQCLVEASNLRTPIALRRLFVTILVFCEPTHVRSLWEEFESYMVEDYPSTSSSTATNFRNKLLRDLNDILLLHGKQTSDFDLPPLPLHDPEDNVIPRIIQEQLSFQISHQDLDDVRKLNFDQSFAFNTIMNVIQHKQGKVFFVDGPGGTGKTFLYRALISKLRSIGQIVLATATSGIAATLLPGGQTAHSRFKIPLNPDSSSVCSISKQSDLAKLITQASAIVWDEAPMVNRYALEAVDRTLRDIIGCDAPFGGKVVILGGDFRQILPVIPKGNNAEMIGACIVKLPLWAYTDVLHLRQNMRSLQDHNFAEYLMRIGDGIEPTIHDDLVKIPQQMTINWKGDDSIQQLIQEIFPNLRSHGWDGSYIEDHNLLSFDEVEGDTNNLYQQEYLNSITPGGLPPHVLKVKKGAPLMLLRNIDPKVGLCNGTRLLCRGTYMNMLDVEVLSGQHGGHRAFLPRIKLKTSDNAGLPFVLIRKQFPVRLSFALTINKAQGQTIPNVGIYLPNHVFGHGQLYVALSRGVSKATTKILIKEGKIPREDGDFTKNIVFKDILLS